MPDKPPIDPQRDEPADDELAPLETPSNDARARLLKALRPALDDEIEGALYRDIAGDSHDGLADRTEWESRLTEWDEQYYGIVPDRTYPWPGCSNLHVPLTMLGVETLKPRLIEAVAGGEPIAQVLPVEASDEERRDRTELFLNWQLKTHMDIEERIAESAHLFLNPGTVIAKTYWKVERTRRRYVRTFPKDTPMDEILQAVLGLQPPTRFEPDGDMRWTGELARTTDGPPITFTLAIAEDDTQLHIRVDRDDVDERPWIRLLDPIDFIAPSNAGADVQQMPWCQERLYLTEQDLRRYVQSGRFNRDAVDELLRHREPTGEDDTGSGGTQTHRDLVQDVEGVDADASDARASTYTIIEDYRTYDIDDDGYDEQIVTWICDSLPNRVLGWDYLANVYAHGRRPYRVGRFFPIPFKFYGLAFAEIIRNLQDEINAIHNQRVDAGTLSNMPWYFYRASSTHNPTTYPLKPGTGIPIDNPQTDVQFPRLQFDAAFGQNEESLVYQYFERLTGLTDLALGRQPSRVGATRTATGVASLLSESGLRFKTAMEAFQRFWVGVFEDVLALDQQYLPPGVEFRVTGRLPEFLRLASRAEIAGKFDITLSATTETINKQVMREDAMTLMQLIASQAGLQMGLVGHKGLRRAYTDLFRAFNKEADLYLEPAQQDIVRTPEEELALILAGKPIKPTPAENLALHMQTHMEQRRDPGVQAALGPEGMKRLDAHLIDTQQLMQTQQLAMQMGGGGPEAPGPINPMGEQGMNALAGAAVPQTGSNVPTPQTNMPSAPAGPNMAQGAGGGAIA